MASYKSQICAGLCPSERSHRQVARKMRLRLTGTFPGIPLELTCHFMLAEDMMRSLEIHR